MPQELPVGSHHRRTGENGCLAALVDGQQKDMSHQIEQSCNVEGIKAESEAGIHILNAALLITSTGCYGTCEAKPTIGQLLTEDSTTTSPWTQSLNLI